MEPGPGQPERFDADSSGGVRRWLSWRRVLAALGIVVMPVLLLVLLAPAAIVDPIVRNNVSGYGDGCAELVGVSASAGRWPVVLRALTGRLSDVSVEIDEVHFGDFEVRDVRTSAERVEVPPLGLSLGADEVEVSGGETSSSLPFDEIEDAYAELDITLTLRRDADPAQGTPGGTDPAGTSGGTAVAGDAGTTGQARLIADVEVPFIGAVPTTVAITPVDGDVEIALAPFEYFWLPAFRIASEDPFEVRSVEVQEDAVRFTSTFEGTLRAEDFGCDVTTESPESGEVTEPTGQ